MQTRQVFIKADGNSTPVKVDFSGQTFGELKAETAGRVTWKNSIVRLKGTKTDLVDDGALIPQEGPVIIFVVPQKMKGGADVSSMSRNELMSHVKTLIIKNGQAAKDYFGNYPQMKTPAIVALVNGYDPNNTSSEEGTLEDTSEMQAVRAAYENVVTSLSGLLEALDTLGSLVAGGEESFGGTTLSELNEAYAQISSTVRR